MTPLPYQQVIGLWYFNFVCERSTTAPPRGLLKKFADETLQMETAVPFDSHRALATRRVEPKQPLPKMLKGTCISGGGINHFGILMGVEDKKRLLKP